jgi:membrane-associated phospholipid phosphatase
MEEREKITAGSTGAADARGQRLDAASAAPTRARRALIAAASLSALTTFLGVTRLLGSRRAGRLDRALLRRTLRARTPVLNGIARDVTSLGGVTLISTATATALVLVRRSRSAVVQLALASLGGVVAELGLKRHVARPRPDRRGHLQEVSTYSFPSGHSIASSCLYLSLAFVAARRAPRARGALLAAAGAVASLVGATRVYLGVHYPSDVLGGLALGTAWACLLEAGVEARAVQPGGSK